MPARRKWTKEIILTRLKSQKNLSWSYLRKHNSKLLTAAEKQFGSLRKAVQALGLDYDEFSRRKPLTRKWVIREIRAFVASGAPLSNLYRGGHNHLNRRCKLLFGSARRAFRAVGYRLEEFRKPPGHPSRWPQKRDLLRAIRKLPATYHESVHRNHRGLMHRAEKLYGSWAEAVKAAGVSYEHVPPPVWPGKLILRKIRRLRNKSHGANADTRLYYAARDAFGSWRYAVELAGYPYFDVEPRFRWTPAEVLYYIRWFTERNMPVDEQSYPELHRNAKKFFGSLEDAIRAARTEEAGIHFKHKVKRTRETRNNPEIAKDLGG